MAQEVGNFLIIVEEAGQAGHRQVEMNALAQAGRDRGCPLIVLTQNAAKLPEEVVNNVKVWVSFAQESKRELSFAADHLRIEPESLIPEQMPTGYAWVRSPEHRPSRQRLSLPRIPSHDLRPTPLPASDSPRRRMIVREVIAPAEVLPSLPMPELRVQALLAKIDRTQGDCWLWTGTIDDDGYGVQRWTYADGRKPNNRPAHQVVWEVVNGRGFPIDEKTGKSKEWDHRRSCPRHCVNPQHGEPVTKLDNLRRMHRTHGHMVAD